MAGMDDRVMTTVLAMRWDEAIAELHKAGIRIAELCTTQPPRHPRSFTGRWRVVRQRQAQPGYVSLTLAREAGYQGKPLADTRGEAELPQLSQESGQGMAEGPVSTQ